MRVRKKICLGHGIEEWLLARSPKKDRGVGKKTEGGAKKDRGYKGAEGRGAAPRAAQGVGKKTLGVRKKGSPIIGRKTRLKLLRPLYYLGQAGILFAEEVSEEKEVPVQIKTVPPKKP